MTPTDAAALRALLARIEAVEGPDRELDAALQWHFVGRHLETGTRLRPLFERDAAAAWDKLCGRAWRDQREFVPRLTGSLDAAVALVDRLLPSPDWWWDLSTQTGKAEASVCSVDDTICAVADGATLALALCTALCRALLARADAGQGDGA